MRVRSSFLGICALFLCIAFCMNGIAAAAQVIVPLRTAWLGEHETFLVWYAKQKGWDKAEGLDLMLMPFDSGKAVIDEMKSADWAIAGVGAMPALTASLSNKIYIGGVGNDESASNALYARADSSFFGKKGYNPKFPEVYGNPGTVRGKTFLCPKGTSAHYMLTRWLHIMGLTEHDVVVRDMLPTDALKTFAGGVGDGVAMWAPQTYEAEKQGLNAVAHSQDCDARQPILIVANMDYANKHKNHIVAFMRVYLRSVDMIRASSPEKLADDYMTFCSTWTGKKLTR